MKKILTILFAFFIGISTANAQDIEQAADYYNQGIDLFKADKVEESIESFEKAIEFNPELYEAYYNLAQIYMSLNKYEEAFEALKNAVKLRPEDSESLYNIGRVQYTRGYLSSSYSYLKKISKKAPQYNSAKLLMEKIEKRQQELNLEAKIKEHKVTLDAQGKAKSFDISELDAPSGVAVDDEGNIYSASYSENAIYKVSVTGKKSVFSKSSLIKGPIGLAIDKNNNIYIANYGASNIIKITPNATASVYADIQKPYCLIYDEIHDRLYATEQNTNKIVKFDL